MTDFATLGLPPPLLQALEVLTFKTMTPVQEHALPPMLAGKDVIAQARTGSGKTAAFGLAALKVVEVAEARVQVLVLVPTRELADQVSQEVRRLARFIANLKVVTLCGGVPVRTQLPSLEHTPHVVVGTPGRILDHLRRESLVLDGLRVLVLDEADRMLDMGFADDIHEIIRATPERRQTHLFSATYPAEIRAMSGTVQRAPVTVTVDNAPSGADIEQLFFDVEPAQKLDAVAWLLEAHQPTSALVFCHTRNDTREVATLLGERGFSVLAFHGELEQWQRDEVLIRFANQSCSILVATDVAARGLDIKGLPAVIAYELPTDPDVHLHRVGRTGRAGQKGLALNLVTRSEKPRLAAIEARMGAPARFAHLDAHAKPAASAPRAAAMVTLVVDGGKRDKLRPGDILGALTGEAGLAGDAIGKIDVLPQRTYVAVRREQAQEALRGLAAGKIKGRRFRVRRF